jgi:hypothetical protein
VDDRVRPYQAALRAPQPRLSATLRDEAGRVRAVPLTADRPGRSSSLSLRAVSTAVPGRQGSQLRTKESGGRRPWPLIMTWCPDKGAVNTRQAARSTPGPGIGGWSAGRTRRAARSDDCPTGSGSAGWSAGGTRRAARSAKRTRVPGRRGWSAGRSRGAARQAARRPTGPGVGGSVSAVTPRPSDQRLVSWPNPAGSAASCRLSDRSRSPRPVSCTSSAGSSVSWVSLTSSVWRLVSWPISGGRPASCAVLHAQRLEAGEAPELRGQRGQLRISIEFERLEAGELAELRGQAGKPSVLEGKVLGPNPAGSAVSGADRSATRLTCTGSPWSMAHRDRRQRQQRTARQPSATPTSSRPHSQIRRLRRVMWVGPGVLC